MARTYQIVDSDVHVNPPATFWRDYLPAHLADLAPKLEHAEDADYVVFEGQRKKISLINAQAGRKWTDYKMTGKLSDARKGGWMPAERLADMDQDGMDVAVIYGGGPIGTRNDELYMESFSAYNRWLADFCSYAPDRFTGVAYLPMREVDNAIRLLREAAKLGFTSANIPAFPLSPERISATAAAGASQILAIRGDPMGSRRYDQPEFEPFWAEVQELGMTLTMHLGGRSPRFQEPEKFLADLAMSKLAMAEPAAIMILGGVFQKFPGLKLVLAESGVGWFPWFAGYMDATWKKHRFWTNNPLTETPSFYMERNVYGSFIDEVAGIDNLHKLGGRNIMWSSDYPHSETTFPNSQETIERIFKGVPEADRALILGGIAKQVFRTGDGWAKPVPAAAE